jgi:hypothetical protein
MSGICARVCVRAYSFATTSTDVSMCVWVGVWVCVLCVGGCAVCECSFVCACVCVCMLRLVLPLFLSSPLTGHIRPACLRAYLLFRKELRLRAQMYSMLRLGLELGIKVPY